MQGAGPQTRSPAKRTGGLPRNDPCPRSGAAAPPPVNGDCGRPGDGPPKVRLRFVSELAPPTEGGGFNSALHTPPGAWIVAAALSSCNAASWSTAAASRHANAASSQPTLRRSAGHCMRRAELTSSSAATGGWRGLLATSGGRPPHARPGCAGRGRCATMLSTCLNSMSGSGEPFRSWQPGAPSKGGFTASTCCIVEAASGGRSGFAALVADGGSAPEAQPRRAGVGTDDNAWSVPRSCAGGGVAFPTSESMRYWSSPAAGGDAPNEPPTRRIHFSNTAEAFGHPPPPAPALLVAARRSSWHQRCRMAMANSEIVASGDVPAGSLSSRSRSAGNNASVHCRGAPNASKDNKSAARAAAKGGRPGPYTASGSWTSPSSKRNLDKLSHLAKVSASHALASPDCRTMCPTDSRNKRSKSSRAVGVQARKPKRPRIWSSARRTADQGLEVPETSTTSFFARSRSR
mmetsp:Transcript_100946/g.290287  ORF Transcript_100946/g.290287 Transcript_100946/m.290287 type:complete len:461 (+) Transcript_100946:145-1527(+)